MIISKELEAKILAQATTVNGKPHNQKSAKERLTPKQAAASPAPLEWSISFTVPIRTESEANRRDHWTTRHRRFRAHQKAVELALVVQGLQFWTAPKWPVCVELVRLGGKPLDTDNLAGSFKGVQDAVAAWMAVDDGDTDRVTWQYGQEKADTPAVVVRIHGRIR